MSKLFQNKKAVGFLFLVYLAVLLYFLFLSEGLGRKESFLSYRYNLVPFKEIRRYIKWSGVFGFMRVFLNLIGNILAFIPFGSLLPVFLGRRGRFFKTMLYGFFFVEFVEIVQVLTKVGCYDVDDIILNMLGILLGYLCYVPLLKIKNE